MAPATIPTTQIKRMLIGRRSESGYSIITEMLIEDSYFELEIAVQNWLTEYSDTGYEAQLIGSGGIENAAYVAGRKLALVQRRDREYQHPQTRNATAP